MKARAIPAAFLALIALHSARGAAQASLALDPPAGRPDAIVDLATREGAGLVRGQWRFGDVKIVEVDAKTPGTDLKPSGVPVKTYDYTPKAGAPGFDDSGWEAIDAASLEKRRGQGKVSFGWYRVKVTIPEKVGTFETAGSTIAFEIVIDDYAEVWVDGKLPLMLGQAGGQAVKGFNAPNRVILTRDAKPGQTFELAVFGMNGPISKSPDNFIWVRSATLDFYRVWRVGAPVETHVDRRDPALDAVLAPGTKIEKLASGFLFTEGPVWVRDGGYLLFSDPNANTIYCWSPDGQVSIYRPKSGYSGVDVGEYGQPGSNGLTLDRESRLTIDQHGNRRVVRLEKNGAVTVLADRYRGKRLNSPNDLVYHTDGSLYFTDPPYGLTRKMEDPEKQLDFQGVYRVSKDGQMTLLTKDLSRPNGIAFSPDHKTLYVANSDPQRAIWMAYDVKPDGSIANGRVFFDATSWVGPERKGLPDGMKVDTQGHLFATGPGGVHIFDKEGKHLGTLATGEATSNCAFGEDGSTLFITADMYVLRLRLKVKGTGF